MITIITTENARENDDLLNDMYRARKRLFVDRLEWPIEPDAKGREIDRFDALSPVYVVDTDERGGHRGSVRLLPTTGETVLGNRVATVLDGIPVSSPSIWEYTRFCVVGRGAPPLSPSELRQTTVDLMLGICETCIEARVDHVIGSVDRRMKEMAEGNGWEPRLLARSGTGRRTVYLGMWDTTERNAAILRAAGGVAGPVATSSCRS